ncbi:MAG: carbohydrate ABC transporter permease [Hyphomicrobiales bacterium]
MRFGTGFFGAIITGAIWGFVWMIILSVIFMLVSGVITKPPVGIAALSGAIGAGFFAATPIAARQLGVHIVMVAILMLVLGALTLGQPLGLPMESATVYQLFAIAAFVGLMWTSIRLCMDGIDGGSLKRYKIEVLFIRVMKGIGFVIFTSLVALPFYVMVMTSLKSQQSLLANPLDFSLDLGQGAASLFRSYVELFTQFNFGTFLLNSSIVSVATVLLTLLFAVPGAYAVSRLRFPGQAFLSRSILLIYMVPAIVLVIPLYAAFSQLGLRNTLTGLLVVYPATTIPVALYMLQGYFRGLPAELEEAGLMDGLSRIGVILKITLPLSLPALASVALYVFMIAWNEFLFAFMFLDNVEIFTLSRGVVSLNSSEVPRQHLMAGAVVATIPVLVIFLWFERFLVSGLTAGSVKG